MNQVKEICTIGIDVSKDKLDIWELPGNKHYVINNKIRAIGDWNKKMGKLWRSSRVLLEPTGGYEKVLIKKLLSCGIEVKMIHPNRLVYFAKSKGFEAKTDKLASMQLALYLNEQPEKSMVKIEASYEDNQKVKEVNSRRRQIKEILQSERNRLSHDYFSPEVKRSIKRSIKNMEKELDKLNNLIDSEITKTKELKKKKQLLETFKGVGRETALALLFDLPELGNLSREAIAKLAGVAPLNNESGIKSGTRHIRGGRGHVRKILYMAAIVASRFNQTLKRIFERLIARGKLFKVAIVAVMRKMLCLLNSMVKKNLSWQEFSGLSTQNP